MSKYPLITTSLFGLMLACSSAPPPQPETGAAPPPTAPPPAEAPPAEPQPEPAATAEAPAPAPEPAPAEPKLSSDPKAIITASEVAFVINYTSSDPSQAAQESCSKTAAEDPAKMAACKSKARDEFLADVIHFKKGAGDKFTWFVYKRKGSNLNEVYSAPVEFGEVTERSVTVLVKGGEGTRPLFKGANKFVVTVPNDYSIELQDPKFGRLVYDAKVGMVGH